MSSRTLFNERFGMLMACASPGSALAYHLGKDVVKAGLVQRRTGQANGSTMTAKAPGGWMRRAFDRLEQWSWERQLRAEEAYLSQATDLCDLESRMRRIENPDGLYRSRALW
jgi:hypothetical protein